MTRALVRWSGLFGCSVAGDDGDDGGSGCSPVAGIVGVEPMRQCQNFGL